MSKFTLRLTEVVALVDVVATELADFVAALVVVRIDVVLLLFGGSLDFERMRPPKVGLAARRSKIAPSDSSDRPALGDLMHLDSVSLSSLRSVIVSTLASFFLLGLSSAAVLVAPSASAMQLQLDVSGTQAGLGLVDLSIVFDDADFPTHGTSTSSIYLTGNPTAELTIDSVIAPVFCCEIEVYDGDAGFGGADGLIFRLVSEEASLPTDVIELIFLDTSATALNSPSLMDLTPFPALSAWDSVRIMGGPVLGGNQLDVLIDQISLKDPSAPIPEPSAALLFTVGALVAGHSATRRSA